MKSVRMKLAANSGLMFLCRTAVVFFLFSAAQLPDVYSACLQKPWPCFHGLIQPLFSSFLFPALSCSIPPSPPPPHSHRLTSVFLHFQFFLFFSQNPLPHALLSTSMIHSFFLSLSPSPYVLLLSTSSSSPSLSLSLSAFLFSFSPQSPSLPFKG